MSSFVGTNLCDWTRFVLWEKNYAQEFKKTIVDLLELGKTSKELLTEYGISLTSINK